MTVIFYQNWKTDIDWLHKLVLKIKSTEMNEKEESFSQVPLTSHFSYILSFFFHDIFKFCVLFGKTLCLSLFAPPMTRNDVRGWM